MSSNNLLAENNPCGRTLLALVARGNAITAELLRLSDFIPPIYKSESRSDTAKYADLIIDFNYFKASDTFEKKVQDNLVLQDLDDELQQNNLAILSRFYFVFESVLRFSCDLKRFVEELEDGFYIQQSLESVLQDVDGAQLMAEALYLCGVILLILDRRFDGLVRERLLVAYYRYGAETSRDSKIDDVCKLLRSTGFTRNKRPPNYPESLFERVQMNRNLVTLVIGKLRSDDIYHQLPAYPQPEHRSTALASQAAMLYVCLFFDVNILKNQNAVMREIVDKYFPDNWVISVYMGMSANLIEAWDPYKAAKGALLNSLETTNVRLIAQRHGDELRRLNSGFSQFVQEANLTDEYVLDNSMKLMNTVRKCNTTLRWLMLHTAPLASGCDSIKKCKQWFDQVALDAKFDTGLLFQLLLDTSDFELRLKEKLKQMLVERESRWEKLKLDGAGRLKELSVVFAGDTPLSRIEKNEKLRDWFADKHTLVEQLDFKQAQISGRKLVQSIRALEEVQEFHNLESQLQVKQFLIDTRAVLHQMLRILNMKDDALVQLQIICDMSYAWEIIDNYTPIMQQRMKKDPQLSIKLRATFLKLSSILDVPLLRIQQADSPDLRSVSQYFSSELVLYIRRVLHVIPETVFSLLAKIIHIQTARLTEVPTRLDKDKMKEFAQFDERFEIAHLTHSISVLAEGVLAMKTTLVGIIKIDPKRLLEDGIRKELVKQLASAMHRTLSFSPKAKQSELIPKLQVLAKQIDGFRRSFEYISDYINMCGLKIWQEEFSRVVNFNAEQECNVFSRIKIQEWDSIYQSRMIPIPKFAPIDSLSLTCIGRLAREILRTTDPTATIYVTDLGFWYDQKTKKECVNTLLWKTLILGLTNIGLSGLDRLYCFMIAQDLHNVLASYKRDVLVSAGWSSAEFTTSVQSLLNGGVGIVSQPAKVYALFLAKCNRSLASTLELLLRIGQMQILRRHIVHELNTTAKFESKLLEQTLQTLNRTLLLDIRAHYQNEEKPYPKDDNPLLYELSSYLESVGATNVMAKVYKAFAIIESFPLYMALVVISQLPKLVLLTSVGLIAKKPADLLDGYPLVVGTLTVLKQFHPSQCDSFLQYLSQYAISMFESLASPSTKQLEMPLEVVTSLSFLKEFVCCSKTGFAVLENFIPKFLLDEFSACASKN